jgi:hypothetical protein
VSYLGLEYDGLVHWFSWCWVCFFLRVLWSSTLFQFVFGITFFFSMDIFFVSHDLVLSLVGVEWRCGMRSVIAMGFGAF